jgi:hypothetical protein
VARQSPQHPGIAARLFGLFDPAAQPPCQREPPVQAEHNQLQPANPVIAAAQVGQLVSQHCRPLEFIQPAP